MDLNRARRAIPDLESFLTRVATDASADEVYVLAHSMGADVTASALSSMASSEKSFSAKFKLVTLASPDIDQRVFREQLAPKLLNAGISLNIYAAEDKAMMASRAVHGDTRVGMAGPALFLMRGVDTVDATHVETDFLGHSKYGDSRVLLNDMAWFFNRGLRAGQREGLVQQQSGAYWAFP